MDTIKLFTTDSAAFTHFLSYTSGSYTCTKSPSLYSYTYHDF